MEKQKSLMPLDCIECGACSYICPAKRPLEESIRLAKREILAKKEKQNRIGGYEMDSKYGYF